MTLHTIAPVFDENSKILVLGSFPSVKSREEGFFYGHPQNRFWKVIANAFDTHTLQSIEEKKANIEKIITNGKKADSLYKKYIEPKFNIKAICLPSTSPANAQWSLDRLCDVWKNELR